LNVVCEKDLELKTYHQAVPSDLFVWVVLMATVPTIIIAHEFYDALPIHQFQVLLSPSLFLKARVLSYRAI